MVSSACRVPSGPVTSRTLTVGSTLRYPCSSSSPSGRSLGRRSVLTRNFLSISVPMGPFQMVFSSEQTPSVLGVCSESRVLLQPLLRVLDFLGDDHVAHVVFVPFDVHAELR